MLPAEPFARTAAACEPTRSERERLHAHAGNRNSAAEETRDCALPPHNGTSWASAPETDRARPRTRGCYRRERQTRRSELAHVPGTAQAVRERAPSSFPR